MTHSPPELTLRSWLPWNPALWGVAGWLRLLNLLIFLSGFVSMFAVSPSYSALCTLSYVLYLRFFSTKEIAEYAFFSHGWTITRWKKRQPATTEHHDYGEIGHIDHSRLGTIAILLTDAEGSPSTVSLRTRWTDSEDVVESISDLILAHTPDQLFSVYEQGEIRYSVDVDLEALFPNYLERVADAELNAPNLRTGAHQFTLTWPTLNTPDGQPLLALADTHILSSNSTVLATISLERKTKVRIHFFTGTTFELPLSGSEIKAGNTPYGIPIETPGSYRLEFPQEHRPSAIEAAILVVAYLNCRRMLRI